MNSSNLTFKYIFFFTCLLFQQQTKAALEGYKNQTLDQFKSEFNSSTTEMQDDHKKRLISIALETEESIPAYILDKLEYTQSVKNYTQPTDEILTQKILECPAIKRDPENPNLYVIDHNQIKYLSSLKHLLRSIFETSPRAQCFNLLKEFLKKYNIVDLEITDHHKCIFQRNAESRNPQIIPFLQLYQKLYPKIQHDSKDQKELYNDVHEAFQALMLDNKPGKFNDLLAKSSKPGDALCIFFYEKPKNNHGNYLLLNPFCNYILLRSLIESANQINTPTHFNTIKFFHAIRDHEYHITQEMLDAQEYNPNQQNEKCDPLEYYGTYPIHAAIIEGNFLAIEQLINHNADLTTSPFGHPNRNAAHFAIHVYFKHKTEILPREPYLKCLDTILQHSKTDINQPVPNTQKTLLEYAIQLYKKDLDETDDISLLDQQEHISEPLSSCIPVDPHFTLLSSLVKHGANLKQKTAEGKTLFELTIKHKKLNDWICDQIKKKEMSK